jgi:hypothetical protein
MGAGRSATLKKKKKKRKKITREEPHTESRKWLRTARGKSLKLLPERSRFSCWTQPKVTPSTAEINAEGGESSEGQAVEGRVGREKKKNQACRRQKKINPRRAEEEKMGRRSRTDEWTKKVMYHGAASGGGGGDCRFKRRLWQRERVMGDSRWTRLVRSGPIGVGRVGWLVVGTCSLGG